ncbi:MAG: hypothetical protein II464_04170 [Oscillospiraceae bacterium]|nr:hypothetical protein [Oscillospiraceae bacterium]
MSKREQNLREFLISTAAGATFAAVLCATLPSIERGLEMIAFYLAFWFVGLIGTWTVIDLRDRYKDEHIGNICRDHIGRITRRFDADDLGRGIR